MLGAIIAGIGLGVGAIVGAVVSNTSEGKEIDEKLKNEANELKEKIGKYKDRKYIES